MAFTSDKVQESITSYLFQRFLAKDARLEPELPFAELGIDSMTVVELVMYIEEEFGISIPADQLTGDNLRSLRLLVACAMANQPA